ncbi:apolipoprotein R-like isoform X1 [Phyllostomus discolor]|uniref:Apolipoprotein R-like isoform X1 n=2 Tax=Phyllostomus discolor TaxID=89673 RepID=A0A7E6CWT8_9CHIR|nr:apolipoprotein R-like isoform X1 [Phyllostomus discolor]
MSPKLQSILQALYFFGILTLLLCPSGLCDCGSPPNIAHGSHHDASSFFSFTTVVLYECDEGYVLVGDPKITCRNSQWSSPAPKCKALCLKPEIENGNLSVDKNLYIELENVTIQCDTGYGIVNNQSITCSENRTWYPEVPTCKWEVHNGCEEVVDGRKLLQCLPNPEDVKMALEVYKLSLEIKRLKQE